MVVDSAVPKHTQLRDMLLRQIHQELAPGDAIASERELMATHSLSRATVRRAIGELVSDQVLVRVLGKGTFVAPPRVESQLHLASFSDDMRRRGHQPSTVLRGCTLDTPPQQVRNHLGAGLRGKHWRIERLRLASATPMALETGWYDAALLPELGSEDLSSIYQLLRERHQLTIDRAEQRVWSAVASPDLCATLAMEAPAGVLGFERRSWAAGHPVEVATSLYRGDRYSLHMSLDSSMPAHPAAL